MILYNVNKGFQSYIILALYPLIKLILLSKLFSKEMCQFDVCLIFLFHISYNKKMNSVLYFCQ